MNRRQILVTTGAMALLAGGTGMLVPGALWAQGAEVVEGDRILGAPDAPITIIEYASLTCPHCARFHADTLPTIKKDWVETGKAKLVYRDFPLDGIALKAAALARCFEGDSYFSFLDILFRSQQSWARDQDPEKALKQLAALGGLDNATAEACMNNEDVQKAILGQRQEGSQSYGVKSTPSVMINGELVDGAVDARSLDALLTQAGS